MAGVSRLQALCPVGWVAKLGSLGGKATFMILYRRCKCSAEGWTLFDMLFVMLAAGLAAILASIFFDRERRVAVFCVSFFVFNFIFAFLFFFWLIPTLGRRQQNKRDKQK